LTENAGRENDGRTNLQDMKMRFKKEAGRETAGEKVQF